MVSSIATQSTAVQPIIAKRDAIRAGMASAYENVTHFLEKIESTKELNIFLHINPHAQEQARAIDKKRESGQVLGKLAGLAIAVKSNICVKGLIANCASKTLANYVSTYNADVIEHILAQDGIIIGMVNQDEFACGASGETSAFGPVQNPVCPGLIPGGSSSGSAAAVSAGLCDIALGSDTGGSIRNPASHCGVCGIKPAYGTVSRYGLIDLSMSLDVIGPLCATLDGAELMLEVISEYSPNDATMFADSHYVSGSGKKDGLRFALCKQAKSLCTDARIYDLIASKSPSQELVSLDHIDLSIQTYYPLVYVEFFSGTRKFDGRRYGLKIEESCGDEVLRRILGGQAISAAEHDGKYYRLALAIKDKIRTELLEALSDVDCIILPTTPILPHKIGASISADAMYAYDAFTIPANLAGISAGVIPAGTIEGIPVGLQVFARDNATLLAGLAFLQR